MHDLSFITDSGSSMSLQLAEIWIFRNITIRRKGASKTGLPDASIGWVMCAKKTKSQEHVCRITLAQTQKCYCLYLVINVANPFFELEAESKKTSTCATTTREVHFRRYSISASYHQLLILQTQLSLSFVLLMNERYKRRSYKVSNNYAILIPIVTFVWLWSDPYQSPPSADKLLIYNLRSHDEHVA